MNEQRVENLKILRSTRKNAGHHSNLNRLPRLGMMLQQQCDLKESLVFHRFDPRSKIEHEVQLREKVNYRLCGMANKLSCIAAALHQEWKKIQTEHLSTQWIHIMVILFTSTVANTHVAFAATMPVGNKLLVLSYVI